jgi:hypothetical protein
MIHIADIEPGGFIVDNEYHKKIGEMIKERDASILSLAGNKVIIYGVQPNGINTTSGQVSYNNKIYRFIGGETQETVTIKRIAIDRPNASSIPSPAFYEDVLEFGDDGLETFNLSELKRWYQNQPIKGELKEIDGNVTNESLPLGWFIADGTNGTSDLRSRFRVALDERDIDYDTIGKIGGSKKHQLSIDELPNHRFGFGDGAAGAGGEGGITAGNPNESGENSLDGAYTEYLGNDEAHENRPPYYTVIVIQFIGID